MTKTTTLRELSAYGIDIGAEVAAHNEGIGMDDPLVVVNSIDMDRAVRVHGHGYADAARPAQITMLDAPARQVAVIEARP